MKRCIYGDSGAFKKLYDEYGGLLYAICVRYAGDPTTAQDCLQDSFVKVFKSIKLFRFEGSFEGWIKRLTVNTCLDYLKKQKKIPFSENIETAYNLGTKSDVLEALEAKSLLQLLEMLPTGYRTVFNMFAIEGYSHAEIAKELGITESTSKSQLFKARKSLQGLLEKRENNELKSQKYRPIVQARAWKNRDASAVRRLGGHLIKSRNC